MHALMAKFSSYQALSIPSRSLSRAILPASLEVVKLYVSGDEKYITGRGSKVFEKLNGICRVLHALRHLSFPGLADALFIAITRSHLRRTAQYHLKDKQLSRILAE